MTCVLPTTQRHFVFEPIASPLITALLVAGPIHAIACTLLRSRDIRTLS